MTEKEIQAKLSDIIKPYVQNEEAFKNLSAETKLMEDLEVNSAHLVDIILDLEEAFDIEIDDEAAEKMLSVGEAMGITQRLLEEQK
jgi:acyl carrier protein